MLASKIMLVSDTKFSQELFKAALTYLRATLRVQANLGLWNAEKSLPLFLANEFDFRQTDLFGHEILFAVPLADSAANPTRLRKQLESIQRFFDGTTILVFKHLSAYQRNRLIEVSVPFIVPGNQLFIPQLAVDLREHFRLKRSFPGDRLSPVSQALFLRHLNFGGVENSRPSDLADTLRYSAMSVGRAFEELVASGLASVRARGRNKHIRFDQSPRELFEAALPRLRSPVKAEHWFRMPSHPKGFYGGALPQHLPAGGEFALSERSSMSQPPLARYAAGPKDWKILQSGEFGKMVHQEEDPNFAVDVWRYDPDTVSGRREIDALSLYLQFREHPDERLETAAEQLLECFTW